VKPNTHENAYLEITMPSHNAKIQTEAKEMLKEWLKHRIPLEQVIFFAPPRLVGEVGRGRWIASLIVTSSATNPLLKASGDNAFFIKPMRTKDAKYSDAVVWLPTGTELQKARQAAATTELALGVVESKRGYGIRCELQNEGRLAEQLGCEARPKSTPWWTITKIPPDLATSNVTEAMSKQGWHTRKIKEIHGFKHKTMIVEADRIPPMRMLKITKGGYDSFLHIGPTRSKEERDRAAGKPYRKTNQDEWWSDPQHQWYAQEGPDENQQHGAWGRISHTSSRRRHRSRAPSVSTMRSQASTFVPSENRHDSNETQNANGQIVSMLQMISNNFSSSLAELKSNQQALTDRLNLLEKFDLQGQSAR